MILHELLNTGKPVIADGGMGTMLFNAGLVRGQSPELWNTEYPDRIRRIHAGYIGSGAQIILTNSFGGNRIRLAGHRLDGAVAELNTQAARLAQAEAAGQPVIVGGSIGPTGELLEPMGTLSMESAVSVFEEQARALAEGGVDVFWIETMSDLSEVHAAVQGCRYSGANLPIVVTMTFDTKGRTMMGVTPEQAARELDELSLPAFGANCGNGPGEIEQVIVKMHWEKPSAVLIAKANAGLPQLVNGEVTYGASPEDMARYARRVLELGAQVIGACCGSTPAHIQAISHALARNPV